MQDWQFNEEAFIEATNAIPIWQRLFEGNYCDEEVEEIKPRYHKKVLRLSKLYEKRKEKEHLRYARAC